jgi:hypothetical protein
MESARLFGVIIECLDRTSVPSGGSPLGTGESPVLPDSDEILAPACLSSLPLVTSAA